MIARDSDPQALQLNSSFVDFQNSSVGIEVPSVSCDLADLNISSNDFDQLLREIPLSLDGLSMPCDGPVQNATAQPLSDLTNMLSAEDLKHFNFDLPFQLDANMVSFFQSLPNAFEPVASLKGDVTPPFSGGSTPQTQSRAASPAWSESSGNTSTSSVSGPSCPGKFNHGNNSIPRHKRPSHRRAEVKRRDKIKNSLDEIRGYIPSLQDKGKLSESAILFKAAEYIHQLKDGFSERGNKAAELRQEIQSLSEEIHSFQETLPASGLKEDAKVHPGLDDLYTNWVAEQSRISTKHHIFTCITSSMFDSFKEVVGSASSFNSMAYKAKEWQTKYLSLPVLRKQILSGMLKLTRNSNFVAFPKDLPMDSSVDDNS